VLKKNNLIFNHIGIFVKNINKSEKHLNFFIEKNKSSKLILDKKLGIKAKLFYDKKRICYELVEPYGKNNPVSGFLKRGTNILNHVAYTSKFFDQTLHELRDNKFMQISKINYSKLFKSRIVFFISPLNYIIEIIELKK
jgi:nitrogen fixation protein FixH